VGTGDGLLQRLFQGLRVQVGDHIARQVVGAGLDAVGFAVQCARAYTDGFLLLVVALGVLAGLRGGHAEVGVAQPQLGQQGVLHGDIERLAQASRREVAKQADARVGIETLRARGVAGFPALEVAEHGVGVVGGIRKLQRQAAGGVGRQLQQADAVKGAAGQRRPVLAGLVRQRELADGLGVTAQGCGEGFAH